MSDKFFLDTNIFVYSFDQKNKQKQKKAEKLIVRALEGHQGIISTQVVQEFFNVATRKFQQPLRVHDCLSYLETVLTPLCDVFPSMLLYQQGLRIQGETGYSFYDSLIIGAALSGQSRILYSEDLQNDQKIGSLKIVDPFL